MSPTKKFILSQIILSIPLIWIGELTTLIVSESFRYWLGATIIFFVCLGAKIRLDEIENSDFYLKFTSFLLIVIALPCWGIWFFGTISYLYGLFGGWGAFYGFLYVMSFIILADKITFMKKIN